MCIRGITGHLIYRSIIRHLIYRTIPGHMCLQGLKLPDPESAVTVDEDHPAYIPYKDICRCTISIPYLHQFRITERLMMYFLLCRRSFQIQAAGVPAISPRKGILIQLVDERHHPVHSALAVSRVSQPVHQCFQSVYIYLIQGLLLYG